MITMKKWRVLVPAKDKLVGYSRDHLTRRVEIETDLGAEWSVFLDLEQMGDKRYIPLQLADGILSAELTRENLKGSGVFSAQLRGKYGKKVRHSDPFTLLIGPSIDSTDSLLENGEGIIPAGTKDITRNGSYDVTEYAGVRVAVSGSETVEEYDGTVRDEEPIALTSSDGYVLTDSNGLKIIMCGE